MTDEQVTEVGHSAEAREDEAQERRNRVRTALAVVLALLVLLLIALSFFVMRVLTPPGRPTQEQVPEGMQWVLSIYGFGPTAFEQLKAPNDTAVSPDGTIWVVDGQRGRILAFDPRGEYANRKVDTGPPAPGAARLYAPSGIDCDEDGNLYVADYGNQRVMEFGSDGVYVREWEVPLPLDVDVSEDRIAVSTRHGIALFTRDLDIVGLIGQHGDGPEDFDMPRGVAQGPDGTIYAADTHNRRVKAYSPEGELLWVYPASHADASKLPTVAAAEEPFQIPSGMTIDGSGRLVLVDAFNLEIVVLDPTREGEVVGRYGEYGTRDGYFAYPTGISYDPGRDWFAVADTENNRAQIVRIQGSGGGLPGAARRFFTGPFRLCAIPLILLLIAVVIAVMRRRARRDEREPAIADPDAEEEPRDPSGKVESDRLREDG